MQMHFALISFRQDSLFTQKLEQPLRQFSLDLGVRCHVRYPNYSYTGCQEEGSRFIIPNPDQLPQEQLHATLAFTDRE